MQHTPGPEQPPNRPAKFSIPRPWPEDSGGPRAVAWSHTVIDVTVKLHIVECSGIHMSKHLHSSDHAGENGHQGCTCTGLSTWLPPLPAGEGE